MSRRWHLKSLNHEGVGARQLFENGLLPRELLVENRGNQRYQNPWIAWGGPSRNVRIEELPQENHNPIVRNSLIPVLVAGQKGFARNCRETPRRAPALHVVGVRWLPQGCGDPGDRRNELARSISATSLHELVEVSTPPRRCHRVRVFSDADVADNERLIL